MVGIIDSSTDVKLEQFWFLGANILCGRFSASRGWFSMSNLHWIDGMEVKEQYSVKKNLKKIKHNFWRFFSWKFYDFFDIFFCSFFNFSIKYSTATAIWVLNIGFWGSGCIRTKLKFWWPVNPGSLAWCTKMLTTGFFKTFRGICPITWNTVKLGENEFDIRYQSQKSHYPTSFQSVWWKSNFSSNLTQNFGRKNVILVTGAKMTENL